MRQIIYTSTTPTIYAMMIKILSVIYNDYKEKIGKHEYNENFNVRQGYELFGSITHCIKTEYNFQVNRSCLEDLTMMSDAFNIYDYIDKLFTEIFDVLYNKHYTNTSIYVDIIIDSNLLEGGVKNQINRIFGKWIQIEYHTNDPYNNKVNYINN